LTEFYGHVEKVKGDEESVRIREQDITRREKALERVLEYHLKNEKLTQREIDQIRAPNRVF
jgi:hypothetical protein